MARAFAEILSKSAEIDLDPCARVIQCLGPPFERLLTPEMEGKGLSCGSGHMRRRGFRAAG